MPAGGPETRRIRDLFETSRAQVPKKRNSFAVEIRDQNVQPFIAVNVRNGNPHSGLCLAMRIYGNAQIEGPIEELRCRQTIGPAGFIALVEIQKVGRSIV